MVTIPLACPMVTRAPFERDESRSNPSPPLRSYQGVMGSPRSASWTSSRRLSPDAVASFSSARVSSLLGRVRVRRHEMHCPEPESAAASQLHSHSRLAHGNHHVPSTSLPCAGAARIVSVGGCRPSSSPQPSQDRDSMNATFAQRGQRKRRTR